MLKDLAQPDACIRELNCCSFLPKKNFFYCFSLNSYWRNFYLYEKEEKLGYFRKKKVGCFIYTHRPPRRWWWWWRWYYNFLSVMRAFYLFFLGKLVATLINYHKLYNTSHNLLHYTSMVHNEMGTQPVKMNVCVYDYSYLHLNTLDCVD